MPLTNQERKFLDAYVYEATHEPFGGPATADLRQRGIAYSDLTWVLTAYDRLLRSEGILPFGQKTPTPPPAPWINLEMVGRRGSELREECERQVPTPTNVDVAPPVSRQGEVSI